MRGRIQALEHELRLDFVTKEEIQNSDSKDPEDNLKKHPRLYKAIRRDHDISELDDPHIVELMRKGTIPPSLSLRAPPTHIGTSHHRNEVFGITKEEISRRYIIKLRKERVRNNEAVIKSLDNLPIKIRQCAQNSLYKATTISQRSTGSDQSNCFTQHSGSLKPIQSDRVKSYTTNPRKQRIKLKTFPKSAHNLEFVKPKPEEETHHVSFEPHTFNMFNSEMPYVFSSGFHGYQNRLKPTRRKPAPLAQPQISTSNGDFQTHIQRVLDSNHQPHFVKTSLIKGQRVKSNYPKYRVLPGQHSTNTGEELYAIKSVQQINEPFIFTSPASPTRVPNPSLYSEYQGSDRIPTSPASRAGSSTLADVDSRENSFSGQPEITVSTSKSSQQESNGYAENNTNDSQGQRKVPVLSLELLKVHENNLSAQSKKTNNACNLTDITERDESNLSKTTRSEAGQDMKISVRINYRSKEEAIEETTSNVSASSRSKEVTDDALSNFSTSSRKSKDGLTPKGTRQTISSESQRSCSTLDNLRVEGHLYGEYSDVEKHSVKEKVPLSYVKKEKTFEGEEIQQIVVDLNALKTVKTPARKKRNMNDNDTGEIVANTESKGDSYKKRSMETETVDKNEFFITYDEPDSAMSHYSESPTKTPKYDEQRGANYDKVTPRTEIDDSGISISTFENETIKC